MSITGEDDIGRKKDAFTEFLLGKKELLRQVARPADIGAYKGRIYVSDRTYKKILILDLINKKFDYIKDEREGAISEPGGLWITDDGYKYIADFGRKQILVFDDNEQFVRAYGAEGQFEKPTDVAVYEDRIYVCDFGRHHIAVVDKKTGEMLSTIGERGSEPGKFFKPTHVITDRHGNIYVDDAFNFRIQKFSHDGIYEKSFGYQGDTLGGLARPKEIAMDREGYLYVVDTAFENVQIFDGESTDLLLFFGGYGPQIGSMYLPNAIHIDYDNVQYFQKYVDRDFRLQYLVFVGNMLGEHKINVYGFGEWTGSPLPGLKQIPIKPE